MKTTFTKVPKVAGSRMITINVDRAGRPFGQLWTFPNTKTEWHYWHALPIKGEHKTFPKSPAGLKAAKAYMESA